MLYEMRTYTVHPGKVPEIVKHAGELSRKIRADNYGKLEGYWYSEFGTLNQVWHLWSYADANERLRLRAELGRNKDWTGQYLPAIRPLLVKQENRLLSPEFPIKPPESSGNIYEFRYYQVAPTQVRAWADLFKAKLPVRERYSRIVGLWMTDGGVANEICHLWAYKDLNARLEARAAAAKDPEWQAFTKEGGPLLRHMQNAALIPAPFSPLQ